ncbi:hypothetical protein B0O99DRAFT_512548 [Bisporella sp. PMI_857]|nr:hypothetical protein B0O99DRAFT_512548 [Bisporella sp. PMI_857]
MVLKNNTNIFNTQGSCQVVCWPLNKAVLATSASIECWCGDKIPAESYKVDDDKCNTPCSGSNNIESTITATPSGSADGSSQKSSPNVAAIAAGVVIGFVAITAIAAGVVLFMRNKKRRQIEEEHRSAAAISNFVNGGKTSPHSAGSSFTDARLDPAVMGRRISVGSIADDQDYSRKILRVCTSDICVKKTNSLIV